MRIFHVADLHLKRAWFDWVGSHCADYDVLVIAGDLQNAFSNTPMQDQARAITRWLLSLTTPTIVCSGNHDYWTSPPRVTDPDVEAAWLRRLAGQGKLVVDGERIEIDGLSVTATGWAQVPNLPVGADIVVTHAPPVECPCAASGGQDLGNPVLWDNLRQVPPRLLLCGHVHQPQRLWCRLPTPDSKTLVLVPGCDDRAEAPAHWVIDTANDVATHSSGERIQEVQRRPLSVCFEMVDTSEGRARVAAELAAQPFPHHEAASTPGLLVKIDSDGTRTIGRFVDREFRAVDSP